jgi:phage terminase large subunit
LSTQPISNVVQLRKPKARASLAGGFLLELKSVLATEGVITWPSDRYRADPCAFAADVLGISLWEKQREILEAVRDHKRVAVRSGHKVSKSFTAAVLAWWYVCSFPDARVVISAPTSRQVDSIIWREIRKIRSKALLPIPGDMHELARSGFKTADFREMVGFTAREPEGVAGVSGGDLLYLLDEASGINDDIFEAIEGNVAAAGARRVLFSNPTQTTGEFFEAFHAKSDLYRTIHVSSEDTPNVRERREVIKGLAGHEWIEEKRLEWGSLSDDGTFVPGPLYKVRVLGEFVENEEGHIVSLHAIAQAEARWADAVGEGRLFVGLDPAGPGLNGDESAFAVRRGNKILAIYTFRGLSDDAHLVNLLGILTTHKGEREAAPVVVIDREGPIGGTVFGVLRGAAEKNGFEVLGVRASERAVRNKDRFERVRDELWWNLSEWLRAGGAIPEDTRLAKELHAPQWEETVTGKAKATGKSELRKQLERSPDRADAVALAAWTPSTYAATAETAQPAPAAPTYHGHAAPLSPYQAQNAFRRRR